jgi:hypothetical protein
MDNNGTEIIPINILIDNLMANKRLDDMLSKVSASDTTETEDSTEITPDEADEIAGGRVINEMQTGCPVTNSGCPQ